MIGNHQDMNHFLYSGMTPRAWRMISYCCLGFVLYGGLLFVEIIQNVHLYKIDQQLQSISMQGESDQTVTP